MKSCLVVSAADNVATALEPIAAGDVLSAGERAVTTREAIPVGHKVALVDIAAGQTIIKYGSSIGTATGAIPSGAHVHTHNVVSGRGTRAAFAAGTSEGAASSESR